MAARITLDQLEKLAARAAGGDNVALAELGRKSEQLNRTLNQRMRMLEKEGRVYDAYARIVEGLGGKTRGSQAHTGSAEQLYDNAIRALRALNYKESTISGFKDVDKKTANKFAQKMGLIGEGESLSNNQVKQLNRFLSSPGWREIKRVYGTNPEDSPELNEVLDFVISSDDAADTFIRGMENFENTDTDIFTTLDQWGFVF